MEVLRLGVESKVQLPAYATATATQDPSHGCDLHHSSWQCWILNPLSEARDQTCNLRIGSSSDLFPLRHDRNSSMLLFEVILLGTLCGSCTWMCVTQFRGILSFYVFKYVLCPFLSLLCLGSLYNANVTMLDIAPEIS